MSDVEREIAAFRQMIAQDRPDIPLGVPMLLDEIDRLRARVAELEAAIRACFDEDDLIPLGSADGEHWYCVSAGGQKAQVFGISSPETQELRRLVPPEEQG